MRDRLIVIAKETIDALRVRIARAADRAETPFAEAAGRVPELLQVSGNFNSPAGTGSCPSPPLPSALTDAAAVISNVSVTRVFRRHEHTT